MRINLAQLSGEQRENPSLRMQHQGKAPSHGSDDPGPCNTPQSLPHLCAVHGHLKCFLYPYTHPYRPNARPETFIINLRI